MFYTPPYFTSATDIPLYSGSTITLALRFIEQAARLCYKSDSEMNKHTVTFLNRLFKSKHLSVFEHSNFVVKTSTRIPDVTREYTIDNIKRILSEPLKGKSTFLNFAVVDKFIYIGGNLRAWIESLNLVDGVDFEDITPTKLFSELSIKTMQNFEIVTKQSDVPAELRRFSVRIVHDRAFTHELVRHRVMSFSQESQRYCNYRMDRFGKQVTFIEPQYLVPDFWGITIHKTLCWLSEKAYMLLLRRGVQPQIARGVLPNACKTEIIVSGDLAGWKHLFKLRTSPGAHPDMRTMMGKIKDKFHFEYRLFGD